MLCTTSRYPTIPDTHIRYTVDRRRFPLPCCLAPTQHPSPFLHLLATPRLPRPIILNFFPHLPPPRLVLTTHPLAPIVVERPRLPEPAAAGGLSAGVTGRAAVPQGAVSLADYRRRAFRSAADGGVLAGVRVLFAGVQAAPAAAVHGVHLRLGQFHHGAAPRAPRVRKRGGCRRRVSFVGLGVFCFVSVSVLACVFLCFANERDYIVFSFTASPMMCMYIVQNDGTTIILKYCSTWRGVYRRSLKRNEIKCQRGLNPL